MNRALWWRTLADARGITLGCAVILFGFHWVSVWMVSSIELPAFVTFLKFGTTEWMRRTLPLPIDMLLSYQGMLSLVFVDPVVLFTLTVYAIARGSDAVSGPLDRGTMEMLLAQPVRRFTVWVSHHAVTCAGAVALAAAGWLGTWVGLRLVTLPESVSAREFLSGSLNVLAFTVFLALLTGLVSSWHRYRWQTISWVGGFFIVQLIAKIVSRASPKVDWLVYTTFFGAYEPSAIAAQPDQAWALSLQYDGLLFGMAAVAFIVGGVIFCRRDLPAPL
jgi:ABC-2 type transport system permease protein